MICKNCSAEYAEDSAKCPYCGSENKEVAGKQKEEILKSYDKEAEEIRKQAENFPEKTANKWTRKLIYGVGILAVAGILITVIFIMCSRLSAGMERKQEQKHLKKLEELYQAEKYDEVKAYTEKKSLWGRTYQKYSQAASVYGEYTYMEEMIDDVEEIAMVKDYNRSQKEELCEWRVESILYQISRTMQMCREYIDDMVFLENEELLEEYYENCVQKLKQFGYTKEEISEIEQWDGESDISSLVQKLLDYFLVS